MKDTKKQLVIIVSILAIFFFLSSAYMWGKLQNMSRNDSEKIEALSEQINIMREKSAQIGRRLNKEIERARSDTAEWSEIAYNATATILEIHAETGKSTVRVEFQIRSYVYAQQVTILYEEAGKEIEVDAVADKNRVTAELTIPYREMTGISCRIEPSAGDAIKVMEIFPKEMQKERLYVKVGNSGMSGSSSGDSDIYEWKSQANPRIRNEYGDDERLKLTECYLRFEYGEHTQEIDLMEFLIDEGGVQVYVNEEQEYGYSFTFTESEEYDHSGGVYIVTRDGYGSEYVFDY